MHVALSVIATVGIASFLAGVASGALALLAISIHKAGHGPLSQHHGRRAGAIARRILTTTSNGGPSERA